MDYSLVVGVDSERNELVVGIVGKLYFPASEFRTALNTVSVWLKIT